MICFLNGNFVSSCENRVKQFLLRGRRQQSLSPEHLIIILHSSLFPSSPCHRVPHVVAPVFKGRSPIVACFFLNLFEAFIRLAFLLYSPLKVRGDQGGLK